jgi:hypothetical protein
MRISFSVMLLVALALSGCARKKVADSMFLPPPRAGSSGTNDTRIVTPQLVSVGKVAVVNTTARFVVLNFPLGKMAAVDQRLDVYRRGIKVGEVKVTGPQREDNTVADLVAGEVQVGDEARTQ